MSVMLTMCCDYTIQNPKQVWIILLAERHHFKQLWPAQLNAQF